MTPDEREPAIDPIYWDSAVDTTSLKRVGETTDWPASVEQWIVEAQQAIERDGAVDWDHSRRVAEAAAIRLWNYLSEGLIPEPSIRLDVERLATAIHASERDLDPADRPFCPSCLRDAQRYAEAYARAGS